MIKWIKIHKQLRPNSDVSSRSLTSWFSFGDLGTGPDFQGMAQGPEAGGPKAEAPKKVKVGSNLRSRSSIVLAGHVLSRRAQARHLPPVHHSQSQVSRIKVGATGEEGSCCHGCEDTCDRLGPPALVPLQPNFTVEEAEAQEGQVTCHRPHSLALCFQSHVSLCSRMNTVTP